MNMIFPITASESPGSSLIATIYATNGFILIGSRSGAMITFEFSIAMKAVASVAFSLMTLTHPHKMRPLSLFHPVQTQ